MSVRDARERADRAPRTARVAFDLVVSKLRRPLVRPGAVDRRRLIQRLARPGPMIALLRHRHEHLLQAGAVNRKPSQ